MTNAVMSNARMKGQHRMNVTLKKKFGDSWTVTCALRNILPLEQNLSFEHADFVRRVDVRQFYSDMSVRVGVSWNFKSGKAFRQKSVESARPTRRRDSDEHQQGPNRANHKVI